MIWVLIGYMYLFIHRPFEIWPVLGVFRLEFLYALLAGGAWATTARKGWLPNPQHRAHAAFVATVILCWLASNWSDDGVTIIDKYLKIFFFYLLLVTTVRDEADLKRLIQALIVIAGLHMLHSFWEFRNGRHEYRMGFVRMIGVDLMMNDPNTFGASILYTLVFVPAAWASSARKEWRCFLGGYVLLSCLCILLTGSRGAFVGLLLLLLVALARSRFRTAMLALSLVALPVVWLSLPPSLQMRFESIVNPEVGPANARESAEGRIEGFWIGVELWQNNPLTGCGPGAWISATGRKIVSHNLYGQILGETGTLGSLAFLAILLAFWNNLRFVRRAYQEHPEWEPDFLFRMNQAVGAAVLLLLFMGNFGHNLFRYNWVWYGGFLILTRYCVEQRIQNQLTSHLHDVPLSETEEDFTASKPLEESVV